MWNHKYLRRLDLRTLSIMIGLMLISLLVISSTTNELDQNIFLTPNVEAQIRFFLLGSLVYLFFAGLDYHKLREWTWILYAIAILMLVGLFFTDPIHHVRRWYRLPLIPFGIQPSEIAKLIVVLALSWFLERKARDRHRLMTAFQASLIAFIPFFLILKQPDLGSALVLMPIMLVMFYFGGVNKKVVTFLSMMALGALIFVSSLFLGLVSHEGMRPYATKVLKDYQYERLNPNNYHQKAALTAIAMGKVKGSGWHKSEFTARQYLPYAHTDSVFPAFTEEFGMLGSFLMLLLFFGLIYFSFQVTAVAKDDFGRLLSAGITAYLAIHVVVNIGMMCGFLPITGVPLILVTSGGSSILSTMMALGILQSVYTRRFMFS